MLIHALTVAIFYAMFYVCDAKARDWKLTPLGVGVIPAVIAVTALLLGSLATP